jgi:probable F420-dependent oxidoreductase
MRFGISFSNAGPAAQPGHAAALARLAEANGFESLWTVEHTVVPRDYASEYPYSRDGKMPGGEDVDIPDPLIWLAHVSAVTERIKLATGILILPQRNPVTLAKEVATLDRLSGGRVILGIGVGWLAEEFAALGVPFEDRGRRTDDYVAALRALWSGDDATHRGEFAAFERVVSKPAPAQAGGPPIVVGGHSEAAARRAGRLGDGFFPGARGREELSRLLDVMRKAATEAGRDPDSIEITAGGRPDLETVKAWADMGVSRFAIPPLGFDESTLADQLPRFADEVIAKAD